MPISLIEHEGKRTTSVELGFGDVTFSVAIYPDTDEKYQLVINQNDRVVPIEHWMSDDNRIHGAPLGDGISIEHPWVKDGCVFMDFTKVESVDTVIDAC